jgi:hypothetical protein
MVTEELYVYISMIMGAVGNNSWAWQMLILFSDVPEQRCVKAETLRSVSERNMG